MKQHYPRKSRSYSTLTNPQHLTQSPHQFRQLSKIVPQSKIPSHRGSNQDKSFSDSQSSDHSCLQKKYYRCGCVSHAQGGCHNQYRDYLSEMRVKRLRKKAIINTKDDNFNLQLDKMASLSLSEQNEVGELEIFTPRKQAVLDKIVEINESAEYSKKKSYNTISIVVAGRKYYKMLNKEQLLLCFGLLSEILQS